MSQPLVIAHRGASGTAPENTLISFRKAMEMEADFIELDIHLSKDGELIVMHDETVNRTTNGKGKIKNLTLAEIKNLDAGSWFGKEFSGIVVPTLEEVFQLSNGKIKILIEVKGNPQKYKGIEQKLIDLIYRFYAKNWCVVQSFDEEILKNIHGLDPTIILHQLVVGKIIFPLKFKEYFQAINPNFNFVSKKTVQKLHSNGKKIFVWTVNDEKRMQKMISSGVDGIITNYPGLLKKLLAKR